MDPPMDPQVSLASLCSELQHCESKFLVRFENITCDHDMPELSEDVFDEDIAKLGIVPLTLDYKNHTQGVERCIKLVTDASTAVHCFEARDGFIHARVNSRKLMPLFE